jgi:hypothetical protein
MACYLIVANIGNTSNATGNADSFLNGKVFIDFTDCNGFPSTQYFTSDGIFNTLYCYDDNFPVTLYFYQNDSYSLAFSSSYSNGDTCGITPTPTPTPSVTPISPQCATSAYDVVLVLDQSGSIVPTEYSLLSGATVDLVSKLSPYLSSGGTGFQIGVVAFSSSSSELLPLSDNQSSINSAIGTRVFGGGTEIALGLQEGYFTSIGTNTRNVNKKIILYTDGVTSNHPQAVLTADTINNSIYNSIYRTEIICVGIGDGVNYSNLYEYAADPSLVYSANTFEDIQSINTSIVNGICQELLTPTPTGTLTQTPTVTQTQTNTQTQTPTVTQTQTNTQTQTPTVTQTQTNTQTQTPTVTQTQTPTTSTTATPGTSPSNTPSLTATSTQTPTNTQTQTATPASTSNSTPTPTPTNTPTNTQTATPASTSNSTPTPTPTNTQTQTGTPPSTPTPTNTSTTTNTPTNTNTATTTSTPTQTPSSTPLYGNIVQFLDCDDGGSESGSDGGYYFRFGGPSMPVLMTGETYYISGGTEFLGCATVVENLNLGPIFTSDGVTFMNIENCSYTLCPRTNRKAAQMAKCSDGSIFYAEVDADVAFPGAAYVYNNECYTFIEFSGPGGPYLDAPDFIDCVSCTTGGLTPTPTPTHSPTPTQTVTPTKTPTPTPTLVVCEYNEYCLSTTLPSLSGYNGTYVVSGTTNSRPYYQSGSNYIYFTSQHWCLSTSLGGPCILRGSGCNSVCPDISSSQFEPGVCPSPTPTPAECSDFDFTAYFDCDWVPAPTPTIIDCDDTSMVVSSGIVQVTPTPSPTPFCNNVSVDFVIVSGVTMMSSPFSVEITDYIESGGDVEIGGTATFTMMEERFNCVSVKVLNDCNSSEIYYINNSLLYNNVPIVIGTTFSATINEQTKCLTYVSDANNISSNASIGTVINVFANCEGCEV